MLRCTSKHVKYEQVCLVGGIFEIGQDHPNFKGAWLEDMGGWDWSSEENMLSDLGRYDPRKSARPIHPHLSSSST